MQLFKKFKQQVQKTITVEEIHNEIYSIPGLIKTRAEEDAAIILNDEEKTILAKKMYELGFCKAQGIKKPLLALNQLNNIRYYKFYYPCFKFITEENVKSICEKYNLYLTEVSRYISDIPFKNQKEIASFQIREKDIQNSYRFGCWYRISDAKNELQAKIYYDKESERLAKIEAANKSEKLIAGYDLKIIAPESQIDYEKYGEKGLSNSS